MSMPKTLVLIRHGESEGNLAVAAAKAGDTSLYTERFMTTPGSQWRLTDRGRQQARTIGEWVQRHVLTPGTNQLPSDGRPRFERFYVSPYVRTRETAGHLGLSGARWRINRALRERDWGDIGSIPRDQFESSPWWTENAANKRADPLYWSPPNGESLAQVAEDRVRNVLDTLHRECSDGSVVITAHGELMESFRLVLERMTDEQFIGVDDDPSEKIVNCEAFHYSRCSPHGGSEQRRLSWMRRARPVQIDGRWTVQTGPWREIEFETFTNSDLIDQADGVACMFAEQHR